MQQVHAVAHSTLTQHSCWSIHFAATTRDRATKYSNTLSDILRSPPNIFYTPSNILHTPLNILCSPPNIFYTPLQYSTYPVSRGDVWSHPRSYRLHQVSRWNLSLMMELTQGRLPAPRASRAQRGLFSPTQDPLPAWDTQWALASTVHTTRQQWPTASAYKLNAYLKSISSEEFPEVLPWQKAFDMMHAVGIKIGHSYAKNAVMLQDAHIQWIDATG